jgi:hypothetical protein
MTTEIKKKILFSGCSYTAGAELQDNEKSRYSTITSSQLNVESKNIARNGNSNWNILFDTLDEFTKETYDYCVIQLSFFNRITLPINNILVPCNPEVKGTDYNGHLLLKYLSTTNTNTNIYADYYIPLIKNFNLIAKSVYNITPIYFFRDSQHKNYIVSNIDIDYCDITFQDIIGNSKNPKCKFGAKFHPLEDGHQMLADQLFIPEIKRRIYPLKRS